MVRALLLPLLLTAGASPDDALSVRAKIKASTLTPGGQYEIEFRYGLRKGFYASESGLPNPILQIRTPPSVELDGPVLRTQRELQQNEFLHAPYERTLEKRKSRIAFHLKGEPGPDDVISLSFTAYVGRKKGGASFVRRRLELPVRPKAKAVAVAPTPSDWGEVDFLDIGDHADDFDLPKADGTRVKLTDYLGKSNVLVTTYRAFW